MVCGNCGKESPDGSNVCVNCGAPLQVGAPAPPPQFGGAPVTMPPAKKNSNWIWIVVAAAVVASCGCCGIFAAILFPVFEQAKQAAIRTVAKSNAAQDALAGLMYANDFDDVLPYVRSTPSAVGVLEIYTKNQKTFLSPTPGGKFDFNLNIAGVNTTAINDQAHTPMWIESLPQANLRVAVGLMDGSGKLITPGDRPQLELAAARQFERAKNSKPLPPDYMASH